MNPEREGPEPLSIEQGIKLRDDIIKVLENIPELQKKVTRLWLRREEGSEEEHLNGLFVKFKHGTLAEYSVNYTVDRGLRSELFIARRAIGAEQWLEDITISVLIDEDNTEVPVGSFISYNNTNDPNSPHDNDAEVFKKYTEFLNDLRS